jgi:hypothetical protein
MAKNEAKVDDNDGKRKQETTGQTSKNETERTTDYRLEKGEAEKLERWLFWIKNDGTPRRRIPGIDAVQSIKICEDNKTMVVSRKPDSSISYDVRPDDLNLVCSVALKPINKEDAKIERELLMKEYMDSQKNGQHLDLLRWNVSKFFLSIQTVFVIVAAKGLMEIGRTNIANNKLLIVSGLAFLAFFNILLCLIWWLRNEGIHAWHRTSITRQRLIELDPRLRQTVSIHSTIRRRLPMPHGTGELECYGPPFAFILLWIGVSILAALFLENVVIGILIPALVVLFTFFSLFMAQYLFSNTRETSMREYVISVYKAAKTKFEEVTIWREKKKKGRPKLEINESRRTE